MWNDLTELSASLWEFIVQLLFSEFAFGVILVIFLLLVVFLRLLVNRSRESADYQKASSANAAEASLEAAEVEEEEKPTIVDLRGSHVKAPLDGIFADLASDLKSLQSGGGSIYQVPWFLSLGRPFAGKTTLFGHTGLPLPLGAAAADARNALAGLQTWVFDRGVVLDLSGAYIDASDMDASQPTWQAFLSTLISYRNLRPLDGVLLSISADDLKNASKPEAQRRLAEQANELRQKLAQVQQKTGMQLPVHVVVTRCDKVPGFRAFSSRLPEERRREIVGWSNPEPPEVPYNPGWVDTVFLSLRRSLSRHQLRQLAKSADGDDVQRFMAFPAALNRLREPLRIFMNQIFSATALYEPFPLRSVSFCGGHGFDSLSSAHELGDEAVLNNDVESSAKTGNVHRRVDFLRDLMTFKLFYEWNLARPTMAAKAKRERQTRFAQSLLALLLILGPLGLWWGKLQTESRGEKLRRHFLVPVQLRLDGMDVVTGETLPNRELIQVQNDAQLKTAFTLMYAANEVPSYRLETPFLPPSWLPGGSEFANRTTHATSLLYSDLYLPTTRAIIEQRVEQAVTDRTPVAPQIEDVLNFESTTEFDLLRDYPDALRSLRAVIDRYNCFTPLNTCRSGGRLLELENLATEVYLTDLQVPVGPSRRFYRSALDEVHVRSFEVRDHEDEARDRILQLTEEMFQRLFDENILVLDLEELSDLLQQLDEPPADPSPLYRQVLRSIDRVNDDLNRSRLFWIREERLDLGPVWREWLREISTSPFFSGSTGRTLTIEIMQRGQLRFNELREDLLEYIKEPMPILASEDGEVVFELSPELKGLRSALEELLGESFMKPTDGPQLTINPPAGQYLVWETRDLLAAQKVLESYDGFIAQQSDELKDLASATAAATLEPLENHILQLVAQSQLLKAQPPLYTTELRQLHLVDQVGNWNEVSEAFNLILERLTAPPPQALVAGCDTWCSSRPATAWCQIVATLETQRKTLMQELDDLLIDEDLYTPQRRDFSWWTGDGVLGWEAYDVDDAEGMKSYLVKQRQRLQGLSQQFARPILSAINTQNCWGFESQVPFKRWKVLLSDLDNYSEKKPGNALAQLEDFLSATMPEATVANCLGTPASGDQAALPEIRPLDVCFDDFTPDALQEAPPCDYFLARRDDLAGGIQDRCDDLVLAAGRDAYRQIQKAFNDRLAGKFPFREGPSEPLMAEARPADLWNFFQTYDEEKPTVDTMLRLFDQRPDLDANIVRGLRTSMAELRSIRDFFSAFLADREDGKQTPPTYDLLIEFRVNKRREELANQIIDWRLTVDGQVILPGEDVKEPGRWVYGEPVELALTWAENAPTQPLDPKQSFVRTVGRTILFDYRNPWALLSLMNDHKTSSREFQNFVDPSPETLRFDIPTIFDVATAIDATGRVLYDEKDVLWTRAYVRVTLLTPDGEKVTVPYPGSFPSELLPARQLDTIR